MGIRLYKLHGVNNMKKTKSEDWEDRFKLHADTQEWFIRQSDFKEAKYFISRLLKDQRQEILNIVSCEIACYSQISFKNTKELISLIKGAI